MTTKGAAECFCNRGRFFSAAVFLAACVAGLHSQSPAEPSAQPVIAAVRTDFPSRPLSPTAVNFLEKAVEALSRSDYASASLHAAMGSSYERALADFPYIEALSLIAMDSPRADVIARLEAALSEGMVWRAYDPVEARTLCSRFYAETLRYSDAFSLLSLVSDRSSADADYVKAFALYGSGRIPEAREAVSAALERWPFDSRFPALFMTRERVLSPTSDAAALASKIVDRLYLWENQNRELYLLAVPFLHDPEARERYIRIYRGMGRTDRLEHDPNPLSAVDALEYGLISSEEALDELSSLSSSGIPLDLLERYARLQGSPSAVARFKTMMKGYDGTILQDVNGDGIIDARISYRLGLPQTISVDQNQDGAADYELECDGGLPVRASFAGGRGEAVWDRYPRLRSVAVSGREYMLKPLSLSWAPVRSYSPSFVDSLFPFVIYRPESSSSVPTETALVAHSAFFTQTDPSRPGGITRVSLQNGVPLTSESREGSLVYSWTAYEKGYPVHTMTDRDGDGYFETHSFSDPATGISRIEIDSNANRVMEYREEADSAGNTSIFWDSDEDGLSEISWKKKTDGSETLAFVHPENGDPVVVSLADGKPRSVRRGERIVPVLRDPAADLWWLGSIPSDARNLSGSIMKSLNPAGSSVVTTIVLKDGRVCVVLRSGGNTYVEISDE